MKIQFRNDTVAISHVGMQEVFAGNRPNDLWSLLLDFLCDLWLAKHESYFASLQKRQLTEDIEMYASLLRGICAIQWANSKYFARRNGK